MQKQNRRSQRQARSSQGMQNAVSLLQQKQNSSPQAAKIDLYNNLKSGLEEKPRGWQAFASGALDGLGYSEKLNLSKEMTEKLNYLEDLNNSVLEQEDFYSKKEFAENKYKPDVLQYMENSAKMAPSDKMLMIQGILNGYNEIRGTDYVPLSIDGFDNNRITVESKKFGGTKVLNLRDEFAGDELINERFAAKMPENILAMQQERDDKEREFSQKDRGLDIQEKNSAAYAVGQSAKSGTNQDIGNSSSLEINGQGYEVIPFSKMNKDAVKDYQKTATKDIPKSIRTNEDSISTINEMREIFKVYPDIGDSFLHSLDEEENSFRDAFMRKFADKEKLAAIQKLKKLSGDLNLSTVLGVPGKSATDILKRVIKVAAPHGKLTKEGFDGISTKWEKRATNNIEFSRAQALGIANQTMILPKKSNANISTTQDDFNYSDVGGVLE